MVFLQMVGRFLGAIAALAVVLGLAWFVLRWMGRRAPTMGGGGARMIKILDRVSTGRNTAILVIRVQDKVLVVAQSEHAFEKLCEFDDPDALIMPPEGAESISFSGALKDAVSKMGIGKKDAPGKGDDK